MSSDLLKKYTSRPAPIAETDTGNDADGTEDFAAFGWLRGRHDRAIMLELRKRTGNILAVGYGYIDRMTFDPSEGITLHAGTQVILIKGRNLNAEVRPEIRLFQGLTRNRVPWLVEADQAHKLKSGKDAVIIDSIEW
jgi:hypothetical protein